MDVKKVFNATVNSVVYIETPIALGSGFLVSTDGWIVTNHHVVQDFYERTFKSNNITIYLKNGKKYIAKIVDETSDFENLDIALLKIDIKNAPTIPLSNTDAEQGDEVITIGHPEGLKWTTTKGIISKVDYDKHIQLDAPINHGNSGGPLINVKGQVVGVNTLTMIDMQNTNFAIKVSWVLSVLNKRGIRYKTDPLIDVTQTPTEVLAEENQRINRERIELENSRKEFYKEKMEFDSLRISNENLLKKGKLLRDELIQREEKLVEMQIEIDKLKKSLEEQQRALSIREANIITKLPYRFATEINVSPLYLFRKDSTFAMAAFRIFGGLFYRFNDDYSGCDRLGFIYSFQKQVNWTDFQIYPTWYHDVSLALDINETVRLQVGIGAPLKSQVLNTDIHTLAGFSIFLSRYKLPIGVCYQIQNDTHFKNARHIAGITIGLGTNFLRW